MIRSRLAATGLLAVGLMQATLAQASHEEVEPATIVVGVDQPVQRIEQAARLARDGDTILIMPGEYRMGVATWHQNRLRIRAPRCCARIVAAGASAEGKAIGVIKGTDVTVENIEFVGARAPGSNGAGIRHEGGRLIVRRCRFTGNQMGLLTYNHHAAELVVEASEFDHNGVAGEHQKGRPIGHQIYVGRIARFTLRESYVHHGHYGHLVKSRASENFIYYNRLADGPGGRASYELEFPDGGVAFVVGNIIQQSVSTENSTLLSYGAEGRFGPQNALYVVNNTFVNEAGGDASFLRVRGGLGRGTVANNLLIGPGTLDGVGDARVGANARARPGDIPGAARGDYRLRAGSPLVGTAKPVGAVGGVRLRPSREYVHPRDSRPTRALPYSPGALQSLAR